MRYRAERAREVPPTGREKVGNDENTGTPRKVCKRLDGVLAVVKTQRRLPREPGCWNCGDLNHIRRNCPKPGKDDNASDDQGSTRSSWS